MTHSHLQTLSKSLIEQDYVGPTRVDIYSVNALPTTTYTPPSKFTRTIGLLIAMLPVVGSTLQRHFLRYGQLKKLDIETVEFTLVNPRDFLRPKK